MPKQKILICGASIAGPCLAYWLNKAGYETHIIEKAAKFRDGGQNIDMVEPARTIVDRMGLLQKVKDKNTTEEGLKFVDANGRAVAAFPKNGDATFTRELEILRGDLAKIFYDATKKETNYRFGLTVEKVLENKEKVKVELSNGAVEEYDLLVSAEGVGSSTRKLVLNQFVKLNYLGFWTAYFRIPKLKSDDHWARWYNAPGQRVILMRPTPYDTQSVSLDFAREQESPDHDTVEAQREKVREVLEGAGWESDRIAANIAHDDDFYLGPLTQVKASRWSLNRVVLVGDAAYGPTPVSGQGTTLAITGAYVLAGEIAKAGELLKGGEAFETRLRPWIEKKQKLPPGVPWIAHPKTSFGVAVFNSVAQLIASKPVQSLMGAFGKSDGKKADDGGFKLPDYKF